MKDIWILREEIGLGPMRGQTTNTYYAFENFEDAVKAFRLCLKKNALTKGRVFDGEGRMDNITRYFDNYDYDEDEYEDEDEYDDEEINSSVGMPDILERLREFFTDETRWLDQTDLPEFEFDDWMFACNVTHENGISVEMFGVDDGPCNGCAPYVDINCFEISDPDREYHCFIEDEVCMEDEEKFGILKLQLQKAEIE